MASRRARWQRRCGRLPDASDLRPDEAEFRVGANGFMSWALGTATGLLSVTFVSGPSLVQPLKQLAKLNQASRRQHRTFQSRTCHTWPMLLGERSKAQSAASQRSMRERHVTRGVAAVLPRRNLIAWSLGRSWRRQMSSHRLYQFERRGESALLDLVNHLRHGGVCFRVQAMLLGLPRYHTI